MSLTIVIPCCNEYPSTLLHTVETAIATSGGKANVIVVDDCSPTPIAEMFSCSPWSIITNEHRCGVGPSRTIGVLHSLTKYVLICDSHMHFFQGWYEETMRRIEGRPKTVHCARCVGFNFDRNHLVVPEGDYCGGTLNVCGPDRQDPNKMQVLEGIWNPPTVKDDAEIACVMGASYIMEREWFLKLNPLAHLRQWGCDEQMLSIKSWLAGGDCRFMANVKIGHRFSKKGDKQPFLVDPGVTLYNKLFAILTLTPPALQDKLIDALKRTSHGAEFDIAQRMIKENAGIVACERARNRSLFVRDFYWLSQKFGLSLP